MAYCPARPPELTHLLTIHLFPHSPTRASSSNSIFTLLLLRSPSYLTPWIVHQNFLPKFLSSYAFSLSSNSLDDIFRSPSLSLTPPPPSTFIPTPTHYDYKFTSLLPLSLPTMAASSTSPPRGVSGEQGMLTSMYAQVREEEQVISLQFVGSQQDVSHCRKKKRKQVDDGSAIA